MLTMEGKRTKLRKSKGVAKKATVKKKLRTLAECDAWFEANWDRAMTEAKENTKRVMGRECL